MTLTVRPTDHDQINILHDGVAEFSWIEILPGPH
jgi:hypothetical protein